MVPLSWMMSLLFSPFGDRAWVGPGIGAPAAPQSPALLPLLLLLVCGRWRQPRLRRPPAPPRRASAPPPPPPHVTAPRHGNGPAPRCARGRQRAGRAGTAGKAERGARPAPRPHTKTRSPRQCGAARAVRLPRRGTHKAPGHLPARPGGPAAPRTRGRHRNAAWPVGTEPCPAQRRPDSRVRARPRPRRPLPHRHPPRPGTSASSASCPHQGAFALLLKEPPAGLLGYTAASRSGERRPARSPLGAGVPGAMAIPATQSPPARAAARKNHSVAFVFHMVNALFLKRP